MTNLNSDIVVSLKTYEDLVAKLNRDSKDMYDALDLKNREDEISQEKYQALLVHHMLITSSNFASLLADHLFWLQNNLESNKSITKDWLLNEIKSLIEHVDQYIFEKFPPEHFKEVEEFVEEINQLKKEEVE